LKQRRNSAHFNGNAGEPVVVWLLFAVANLRIALDLRHTDVCSYVWDTEISDKKIMFREIQMSKPDSREV